MSFKIAQVAKVFATTETGAIIPVPSDMFQFERIVNYVDVTSIGSYTRTQIPTVTGVDMELTFWNKDFYMQMPETGILNVAWGNDALTIRYMLTDTTIVGNSNRKEQIIRLIGQGEPKYGEHAHRISVVRFEVGDGTYRQLYAHDHEKDLVIERQYNRLNLWN